MRAAARIAVEMELLSETDAERQNGLLDSLGFPPVLAKELVKMIKTRAGREKFFAALLKDKKASSGRVEMVLLCKIGKVKREHGSWTMPVGERLLDAGLEEISG
jgi:3-dehydroquinate synthetase